MVFLRLFYIYGMRIKCLGRGLSVHHTKDSFSDRVRIVPFHFHCTERDIYEIDRS